MVLTAPNDDVITFTKLMNNKENLYPLNYIGYWTLNKCYYYLYWSSQSTASSYPPHVTIPIHSTRSNIHLFSGYSGFHCENIKSSCLSSPCLHGGVCIQPSASAYYCECPDGYTGDHCHLTTGCPEGASLCENGGTCVLGPDGASCICLSGQLNSVNNKYMLRIVG